MNGTLGIRINTPKGPVTLDVADYGPYPLYSSIILSATQNSEIRYFGYGRGSPKPGSGGNSSATKLDTNVESSDGKLDTSAEMLIYSLRLQTPSDIILADLKDLLKKTYTALYIAGAKPASEGPIEFYPAAGGIFGQTTNSSTEQWTNGVPQASAGRVFAQPHYLPGGVTFSVAHEFPNGALAQSTTQNMRAVVDGLRKRIVQ